MVKIGSSFKKGMFDENISEGLATWAQNARRRGTTPSVTSEEGAEIQMTNTWRDQATTTEQGATRVV
jgi:mlo protein